MVAPVTWVGLPELEAAVASSIAELPTAMTKALEASSRIPLERARAITAVGSPPDPHPGLLRSSWGVQVALASVEFTTSAPYGAGATWGSQGKWSGFAKYGGPPRFIGKMLDDSAEELLDATALVLAPQMTMHGWARP